MTSKSSLLKAARLSIACAFAALIVPAVSAADETRSTAEQSNKAAALPVTAKFEKGASKETLKVSAKQLLAVAYHAENKAKDLGEQTIPAGKEHTFSGLAADDRVVLTAQGYAPMTLTVK